MSNLDFIYKRKSIRNYKEEKVPREDIIKMIDAAIHAPSPMNEQGWHFIVVQNKEIINKIADAVSDNHKKIASLIKDEEEKKKYISSLPYHLNFQHASCTVLIYVKPGDRIVERTLRENNYNEEIIESIASAKSEIQAAGAAVENFLLAAADMGYGACYMTGISIAKNEIERIINFNKEDYSLIAAISVGVPENGTLESRKSIRKPVEEVLTFI